MKKILTFTAALCLLLAISVNSDFRKSGFTGGVEETLAPAFFGNDTIFAIHETFYDGKLDGWTEVGGVSVVSFGGSNVLKVLIDDGTADYISQSILDVSECEASWRIYLKSGYSGWDNSEGTYGTGLHDDIATVGIYDYSGAKKFRVRYSLDAGPIAAMTATTLSDDTWYAIRIWFKKATSAGANNGFVKIYVDGDSSAFFVDLDNDAVTPTNFYVGHKTCAGSFDAIIQHDDVKVWTPEGLP